MNLPADANPSRLFGATWGAALALALLLALGAGAAARWMSHPQDREEIVQMRVPDVPPAPKQELTAPDPGD